MAKAIRAKKPITRRWMVTHGSENEAIPAFDVQIMENGTLAFFDENETLLYAYAHGTWTEVLLMNSDEA